MYIFVILKHLINSIVKFQGEVNVGQNMLPMFLKTAESLQVRGLTETSTLNPKVSDSHYLFLITFLFQFYLNTILFCFCLST